MEENKSLTKRCAKCGVEKPISDFYKKKGGKFGARGRCKECILDDCKDYMSNPGLKEHRAEYIKNYNNRPEIKKYQRERKKEYNREYFNRPEVIEYRIEYMKEYNIDYYSRPENTEHRKEYDKKYKKEYIKTPNGKSSIARSHHTSRSKSKHQRNDLTLKQWNKILKMQNNKCANCGKEFGEKLKPTRDHIIPLSTLLCIGLTFGNVQALCQSCNSKKHNTFELGNAIDNILVNDK